MIFFIKSTIIHSSSSELVEPLPSVLVRGCASVAVKTGAYLFQKLHPKSQAPETSNPSRGADLTGSGRGVVDAILISKAPNSSIFLARPLFVRLLLRLLFELSGISARHLAKIR